MSRPLTWEPLRERDPLPGDPYRVAGVARRFRDTAELLQEQAERLRRLADGGSTRSEAWAEFASRAPALSDRLARAQARYAGAGVALARYSDALGDAQAEGDGALRQAQDADARRRQAQAARARALQAYQAALREYQRRAADPLALPSAPPDDHQVRWADREVARAVHDVDQARQRLDRAVAARDAAARQARQALEALGAHDGLDDSRWSRAAGTIADAWTAASNAIDRTWERVKELVGRHADWIRKVADVAGWVATIAGTAALLVSWIPVVGQALAAVLGAIALGATLVALLGHATLAMTGHGDWLSVGIDLISLLTFGLGRVFTGAAKASYVGARASARMSARAVITHGPQGGTSASSIAREVNRVAGGTVGAAVARPSTVAAAGTRRLPAWQHWRNGWDPRAVVREAADDIITATADAQDVIRGTRGFRSAAGGATGPTEVRELFRSRSVQAPFRTVDYSRLIAQGHWQLGGSYTSTGVGTLTDVADKREVFDGLKARTHWAP